MEDTGLLSSRFRDLIKFVRLHTSVQSLVTAAAREKQPYAASLFFRVLQDLLARECRETRVTVDLYNANAACSSVLVDLTSFSTLTALLALTLT